MFLLLAVLLIAAMVLGLDPERDFSGGRLFGTLVYSALLLSLLGVAAFLKRVEFDRRERTISTRRSFVGIEIKRTDVVPVPADAYFTFQTVSLMKGRPGQDDRFHMLSGFLSARTHLFRLFLDHEAGRLKIEEATYREEIQGLAETVSQFMELPLREEEL